ncbi:tyrosine-protein phosphatase, putative [Candida dubliniensis CD36]|uniref:protein-tyrosine-phosphatase n=1 Tax=Candida dubliniensis (strain CD36 / ATCC MYA-646 / CBS 7987 / NCPF 3949 / NRRL Y-17841) TaxID=573826 RepID=B9WN33_CANDC|nr:tyrosine-protein phosphatase, putative [Candida dubliniensis CD36]CAX40500.1 tyrosine-protein phosphatase, putative [Candida dubliniensis CD36]
MSFTFPNNTSNTEFKSHHSQHHHHHHQQQQQKQQHDQQSKTPPSSNFAKSASSTNNENATTGTANKPTTSSIKRQQLKHKTYNDSISSLTSNTSDLTICESSLLSTSFGSKPFHKPASLSTDTLVEEKHVSSLQPHPPQSSSQGKHAYNQSLDSHRSLLSLDENEEVEGDEKKSDKAILEQSEPMSAIPKTSLPLNTEHKSFAFSTNTTTPVPSPAPPAVTVAPASPVATSSIPRPKLATIQSLPHLKKQVTSPSLSFDLSLKNIKQEQQKKLNFIPSQNFKFQIEKLSDRIKYLPSIEMSNRVVKSKNLVVDIRPFVEYSKSHIKDSINICLPSTLLKRTNFSLIRSINSLPDLEKIRFTDFLNDVDEASESSRGDLIVYDSVPNSSNVFHICNKIINCPLFMSSPNRKLLLMESDFNQFYALFPELFASGVEDRASVSGAATDNSNLGTSVNNFLAPIIVPGNDPNNVHGKLRSNSLAEISPYHKSTPLSSSSMMSFDKLSAATPILSSNFTLPSKTKTFKLRHNEELLNNDHLFSSPGTATTSHSNVNPFELNSAQLFKLKNIPSDHSRIPLWMRSTILDSNDTPMTNKINQDFHQLEKLEQKRLLSAFSLDSANSQHHHQQRQPSQNHERNKSSGRYQGDDDKENISPTNQNVNEDEIIPKISCGIEFGHKNRYKDIFLYDHSRVELGHVNKTNENAKVLEFENYINASLIEPPEKYNNNNHIENRYIATQGPLDETMGDLWKLVIQSKIPLIISLTDSIENGIMKCAPFWQSGIYKSYKDTIKVSLIEENRLDESLILRKFNVRCKSSSTSSANPCEYDSESQFDSCDAMEVCQIQLLSWPDMGTLTNPHDILKIIKLKQSILANVQSTRKKASKCGDDDQLTTLVHCSAGCGRTGTLCVIDTIINYIEQSRRQQQKQQLQKGIYNDFDNDPIFEITNHYRKLRISMVQTLKQYYMIYETLLDYYCNNDDQE